MKTSFVTRAIVILCFLVPALAFQYMETSKQRNTKTVIEVESLPEFVGDWVGESVELSPDEKEILHTPSASQRIYSDSKSGNSVQILLVQISNTQNAHDPRFCMTGSGYGIKDQHEEEVDWANNSSQNNKVTSVEFEKQVEENGVKVTRNVGMFYWLQTPDDIVADMSSGFKLEGIKRALRGQATKGIAVRLICLPNRITGKVTSDEAGIDLWKKIDSRLDIQQLAKEM